MAAYHQATSSSSRPPSAAASHAGQHPQLRLPLSHHGLPRAPTSPESSFSTRSQRYEPLSKNATAAASATSLPLRPQTGHRHRHQPSVSSLRPSTATGIRRSSDAKFNHRHYSSDDDEYDYDGYDDESGDDADYLSSSPGPAMSPPRTPGRFFRLSVASSTKDVDAPPSPPMTPFSPGAFPGTEEELEDDDDEEKHCCHHCRCSHAQVDRRRRRQQQQQQLQPALPLLSTKFGPTPAGVQRARSMDEIPSPIRRMMSTRSVGGSGGTKSTAAPRQPENERDHSYDDEDDDIIDPAVQRGFGSRSNRMSDKSGAATAAAPSSSASSSPSFAAKFGKKIKQKLATAGQASIEERPFSSSSKEGGSRGESDGRRMRASSLAARVSTSNHSNGHSKRVEYEEMEDVHWSEI